MTRYRVDDGPIFCAVCKKAIVRTGTGFGHVTNPGPLHHYPRPAPTSALDIPVRGRMPAQLAAPD
jgi:hypothetical protein